ncbi:hypothetical protein HanPSC8_Chr16g0732671 [Helianthus annuus]|nr:hypothetical protein HanPSC8_Chr16g0732671 [Helianthus annuus]
MYLVNSLGNKTLNSPALSDTLVCMLLESHGSIRGICVLICLYFILGLNYLTSFGFASAEYFGFLLNLDGVLLLIKNFILETCMGSM